MKGHLDIEGTFASYVKKCFPFGGVGAHQLEEMRRVFWAGVATATIHIVSLGNEGWSEDEAMKEINRIIVECRNFADRVRRTQSNQ
jgi:hypothetical protein